MKISSKKTSTNKRLHIYYSGSVQGIGFRYTAERLAGSLNLTGWASNLPDGRVEVLCEGAEPDIKTFLAKIDDIFKNYIRDSDVEWSGATGEFDGFDIRF
ncbi:MAG: acylphosphatase [Candidatus Omnitrophica bacterium]|nr:acylphosphatase [Candidatus Omnitrophota bacterium]